MHPFVRHKGLIAPLDRGDVDTDAIIPKQYLKAVSRDGFGAVLFDDWRYLDSGTLDSDHQSRRKNPDFILNKNCYLSASILLARHNFGCGSSREHAVWALYDYGFRCVIASSYADIFYSNCLNSGLLPVVLEERVIERLFELATKAAIIADVDLTQQLIDIEGEIFSFSMDEVKRNNLLNGLDKIGLTLSFEERISAFEAANAID